MFKNKTNLLIIALAILIVVIVILQIFVPKKNSADKPSPSPVGTTTPNKTQSSFLVVENNLNSEQINITGPYYVTFSEPTAISYLNFSIIPQIPINTTLDSSGTVLTITPAQTWSFGTEYQLIIKRGSRSLKGEFLDEEKVLKFKVLGYGGI